MIQKNTNREAFTFQVHVWVSGPASYQRGAGEVLCLHDGLQQVEEADGDLLHHRRAALALLNNPGTQQLLTSYIRCCLLQ